MEHQNVRQEQKGHIRILYLNHPPVNSWDLATVEEFEKIINALENDTATRVIILTGAIDNCFSAGFDIKDTENAIKIGKIARGLWKRIDRFPKPVIAAINGFALGGGLELAMACHFRIMADDPKITVGLTELNLGIIPGWGGTQLLPRLVGRAKALDMILFSKRIQAQEALRIGLVNLVSQPDQLMADALDFAQKLAERPPIALSCVLKAMAAGAYEGLEEGWRIEAEGSARVRNTKDRIEGFKALLEKRQPVFKGE